MQATEVVKRFQPESYSLYVDSLTASLPVVPRLYIATSKDKTTPPHLQKVMTDSFKATEIGSLDTRTSTNVVTAGRIGRLIA